MASEPPDAELLAQIQKDLEKLDLGTAMKGFKENLSEVQSGDGTGAGPSTTSTNQNLGPIEADLTQTTPSHDLPEPSPTGGTSEKLATVLIMVGMAGSGKTSWTHSFAAHLVSQNQKAYILNLDPGCRRLPYQPNIDIRDSVDWRALMKSYKLGPNGATLTGLNLFSLQFPDVLKILEKRAKEYDYILIDTPGQLECFLWSASGSIITQGLAHRFPTTLIYVMDLSRCNSPVSYTQSMLNALSILYKNQLPMIVTMNKIDVDPQLSLRVTEWIHNYDAFQEDLLARSEKPFSYTLASSFALSLDKFHKVVKLVHISAREGFGMSDFIIAVKSAKEEYLELYIPFIEKLREEEEERNKERKTEDLTKLLEDMKANKLQSTAVEDLFSVPQDDDTIDLLKRDADNNSTSDSDVDEGPDEFTVHGFHDLEIKKRKEKMDAKTTGSGK